MLPIEANESHRPTEPTRELVNRGYHTRRIFDRVKGKTRVIIGNTGYDVAVEARKWANQCVGQCQTASNSISTRDEALSGPATAATERTSDLLAIDRSQDRSTRPVSRYIDPP